MHEDKPHFAQQVCFAGRQILDWPGIHQNSGLQRYDAAAWARQTCQNQDNPILSEFGSWKKVEQMSLHPPVFIAGGEASGCCIGFAFGSVCNGYDQVEHVLLSPVGKITSCRFGAEVFDRTKLCFS